MGMRAGGWVSWLRILMILEPLTHHVFARTMISRLLPACIIATLFSQNIYVIRSDTTTESRKARFDALTLKAEKEAIAFAEEVGRLLQIGCDKPFDVAQEVCESPEDCPEGYAEPQSCDVPLNESVSEKFDNTSSSARRPTSASPYPGHVIKAIDDALCSTRGINTWLLDRSKVDDTPWAIPPEAWFFGSSTGAFRMWPSRKSICEICFYDPRRRPWYVAGRSLPKNIVLIIDASKSMNTGNFLSRAKNTAKRIVATFGAYDWVTVIAFSNQTEAILIDGVNNVLFKAPNKTSLNETIHGLNAGNNNFDIRDALDVAFQVINNSIDQARIADCHNSAILLITAGRNANRNASEAIELFKKRTSEVSSKLGKPVFLLMYSVSKAVDPIVAELACAVENAFWTKIGDDYEIPYALNGYDGLFATGQALGVDNKTFSSWVEVYTFSTGCTYGTTVSAPVYDHQRTPPLFLGAAGIDFVWNDINYEFNVSEMKDWIKEKAKTAEEYVCPELSMSKCQFQEWISIEEHECETDNCAATTNTPAKSSTFPSWGIALIVIAHVVMIGIIITFIVVRWRSKVPRNGTQRPRTPGDRIPPPPFNPESSRAVIPITLRGENQGRIFGPEILTHVQNVPSVPFPSEQYNAEASREINPIGLMSQSLARATVNRVLPPTQPLHHASSYDNNENEVNESNLTTDNKTSESGTEAEPSGDDAAQRL